MPIMSVSTKNAIRLCNAPLILTPTNIQQTLHTMPKQPQLNSPSSHALNSRMPTLQMRHQIRDPRDIRQFRDQFPMESRFPLVLRQPNIAAHFILPTKHEPRQPQPSKCEPLPFRKRILEKAKRVARRQVQNECRLAPELVEDDV